MNWNCEDQAKRLPDYLAGTLSAEQRNLFERHGEGCKSCRNSLHEFQATWRLLDHATDLEPSPSFVTATLEAAERIEARQHPVFLPRFAWAAAAALLVGITLVFLFQPTPQQAEETNRTVIIADLEQELLEEIELLEDLTFLREYGEDLELAMEYDFHTILAEGESF